MGKAGLHKNQIALDISERQYQIARMYLQGVPQMRIGRQLGISQPTVSKDLKAIRTAWLESAIVDLDKRKAIELAKIDEVERNAWEQWEASKEDAREIERQVTGEENGKLQLGEGKTKLKGQTGNPKFLEIVLSCIDRRAKMFGLDAPIKFAETDTDGRDIAPDERSARLLVAVQALIGGGPELGGIGDLGPVPGIGTEGKPLGLGESALGPDSDGDGR